jgi:hypothetical protein
MSINTPLPPCPEVTVPLFALIDRLVDAAVNFRWPAWTPAASAGAIILALTVTGLIVVSRFVRGNPADDVIEPDHRVITSSLWPHTRGHFLWGSDMYDVSFDGETS